LSSFNHEIFISESAYLYLVRMKNYKKKKSELYNYLKEKCDDISSYINLKKGMSVMLVEREDNVYFVYNQCLDSSFKNVPNNKYLNSCISLGRDRNIFKPKRNVKVYLNSYVSWYRLTIESIECLVDKNYMFCKWK